MTGQSYGNSGIVPACRLQPVQDNQQDNGDPPRIARAESEPAGHPRARHLRFDHPRADQPGPERRAREAGHHLLHLQSNAEYELIDRIHAARDEGVDFIIINPAAFTHTSVALRDALLAVSIPFIEVHLSNVHKREPFRHHSYFSDVAVGVICGLGATGYRLALESALEQLQRP